MNAIYGTVLGNGPSIADYDGSGHIIIGCNLPSRKVHATVITDPEIIRAIYTKIDVPLIVSNQVMETINGLKPKRDYSILETFQTRDWNSSGHYAARYLIARGCTHIDLWGCDSQTTGVTASLTDVLMPPCTEHPFAKRWKEVWNQMISDNPDVVFTFHQPLT